MAHSIKTVYVVHHSHTDIGYTDLQERVIAIQVNYIKTVLSMMRQPEYADFRWNCETLYCVEEFWKQASEDDRADFARFVKEGKIGISANYLNFNDLVNADVFGKRLAKWQDKLQPFGTKIHTAMAADVNGFSMGYRDAMIENGVEFFFTNVHCHHGMYPLYQNQNAFFWENASGQRLLVWNGEHYNLGNVLGLQPNHAVNWMMRNRLGEDADAGTSFSDQLHLCLGCYAPHSFICGGSQLALTLGHTTNISWRGLGGDDFFFRPLAGQICPTARVPLCIGQRAALDLFGADTALIGGVDADGFGLLGGTAFPVFFYLFAGNLAPLLHGEICVLLDDRIGCIGYHRAGILRSCIITVSLRRSAFSQHGSAFLLGLRPRLFQRSFRDFPGCIASRHMRGWLFFNIFHGITPRHKLFKLNFKIVQTAFKFYTQVAAIISLVIKTNAGSIPHTTAP